MTTSSTSRLLLDLATDGAAEARFRSEGISDPDALHIYRAGVVVRAMMLLERRRYSTTDDLKALREIRNAVIHNVDDLAMNRNTNAHQLVSAHLARIDAQTPVFNLPEPIDPYFSLSGSIVRFDRGPVDDLSRRVVALNQR